MRRFECHRHQGISGVSGTGVVSQGCVFDNGKVVVTWLTEKQSTTVFDSLDDAIFIHGHGGATEFVFLDEDADVIDRAKSQALALVNARRRCLDARARRKEYQKTQAKSFEAMDEGEVAAYNEVHWAAEEAGTTVLHLIDRFLKDQEPEWFSRG